MTLQLHSYRVGNATVSKIQEMTVDSLSAGELYVGIDQAAADAEAAKWVPDSVDGTTGHLKLGFHAWLVQTPSRTILVDTGAGAEKERPSSPMFGHLHEPFLAHLQAAGTSAEEIDVVLHTHLHLDHVGWNTFKSDEQWLPTFPNARHFFSAREHAYVKSIADKDGKDIGLRGEVGLGDMATLPTVDFYNDSLLPVIAAGLTQEIEVDENEVLEGFTYHSMPGHSIDHAGISLISEGERAFFWGDVVHHPIQFAFPAWNSTFCEFPEAAVRARAWAMSYAAENRSLVFATHLPHTSVGHVFQHGDAFRWKYAL